MLSQIVPSITNIIKNFDHYVENGQNWVNGVLEGNPEMRDNALNVYNKYSEDIEKFLNETVLQKTSQFIMTISLSVINVLKVLWDFIIGFIISIYVLASKERFAGQAKKIIYAIFERDTANIVINDFKFTHKTFIGFIGGKAVDSIIIGLLCFIGTTLMGTPYASLISLVIGVTNIIPFFGPFVGGIPCSFLVFIVDPTKPLQCVYFMLFVLALQQFDGNILGPKILGSSTGLAGFWVIFAITVFGGMWGVFGMIVGVPIFAVLFAAIRSLVNASLYKKKLPTDSRKYINACMVSNEGIESVEDELADPKLIMHNPEVSTWYGDKFVCNTEEHQELIQEHIRLAKEKAEKKQNENKDSNVKSSKGSK